MGNFKDLASMIPGVGKMIKDVDISDDMFKHVEAIIHSMTMAERQDPSIINQSRKARIAKGAGREVVEVNKLLKQFEETRKMMKLVTGNSGKQLMNNMRGKMRR